MLDVERQAHAALPYKKQQRFEFLLRMRNELARTSAELACWGVIDAPTVDRQLVLLEDTLTGMVTNRQLAALIAAEWAANDAALLHAYGSATWCGVCTRHGHFRFGDLLGSLTAIPD